MPLGGVGVGCRIGKALIKAGLRGGAVDRARGGSRLRALPRLGRPNRPGHFVWICESQRPIRAPMCSRKSEVGNLGVEKIAGKDIKDEAAKSNL